MMNICPIATVTAGEAAGEGPAKVAAETPSASAFDWLSFSPDGFVWQNDWWKVLILALGALLVIYLTVRLGLYIARIIGVIICLLAACAGAYVGGQLLGPMLAEILPESCQRGAPFLAGIGVFVVIYAIGMLLMAMIRKPAKADREK